MPVTVRRIAARPRLPDGSYSTAAAAHRVNVATIITGNGSGDGFLCDIRIARIAEGSPIKCITLRK
jgi:hypothetical protein